MSKFVFNPDWRDFNGSIDPDCSEVEYCCGAFEVGGITEDSVVSLRQCLKDQWHEDKQYWLDNDFDILFDKTPRTPSNAYFDKLLKDKFAKNFPELYLGTVYFMILIEPQLWVKSVIVRKGFRLVSDRTVNSNSKNRLYVFIRDPVTPKGSKLKSKRF